MKIGYARVSTVEQDVSGQIAEMVALGVDRDRVYVDHGISGSRRDRPGLREAMACARNGDVLVVHRLDRLGRSLKDLLEIVETLHERGVILQVGTQTHSPDDPMGRLLLSVLGMVAEFEAGLIRARTREAMQRPEVRARLRGKQPSTTPSQDREMARLLAAGEMSAREIGELFGVSRPTVYRAAARHAGRQSAPSTATA